MKKAIFLTILAILFGLSLLKTASLVAEDQKPPEELFIPFMFTCVCSFFAWKSFRDRHELVPQTDPLPEEIAETFFSQSLEASIHRLRTLANEKGWNNLELKKQANACVAPILQKALSDGFLSHSEEEKIQLFCQSFELEPAELNPTASDLLAKGAILRDLASGEIKKRYDFPALPFTFVDGELPIWLFYNVGMGELKTQTNFEGNTQGTNLSPLILNRFGASLQIQNQKHKGQLTNKEAMEYKGQANVLIASKHIYFQAVHDVRRIEYTKILSLQPSVNEIALYYEGGKALFFAPDDPLFFVNAIQYLIKINTGNKDFEKTNFEPAF